MTETAKDPKQFPLLRNLQFSPLKQQDEQYVVLWDPTGLSAERLIVPLDYFYLFQHFDGEHSLEQIGVLYLKKFGEFLMPDRLQKLVADLDEKLFLEGKKVEEARQAAREAYRAAPVRPAVFSGKSYEGDSHKLKAQLESFLASKEGPPIKPSENKGRKIRGLVAPHYEPRLAGPIYAWAYGEFREAEVPDLFLVLGTCNAGLSRGFAVTDKDFETPLGVVPADRGLLDRFRERSGSVFFEDDLSHRHEHSIEFQLPFLQHMLGDRKPISILPVLCAFPPACLFDPDLRPLADGVQTCIRLLKETLVDSGRDFCVIASAELAHIGMRYGDSKPPTDFSFHRCMQADLEMLKLAEELKPDEFARFIHEEQDARRITGFAAIYTLLKLIQADQGQVLRYDRGITDQYNSTVTYCSMAFY